MALNACVEQILCGLSQAALGALAPIIETQKAALAVQLNLIQAQLLALDVAKLPVEAALAVAQQAINATRAAGDLVPLDLIANCADLGDLFVDLSDGLDLVSAEAASIAQDAASLLSFSEELAALRNEIDDTIALYDEILALIATCFT
jgi:hypothetical protein